MKSAMIESVIDLFDEREDIFVGAYGNKATDTRAYAAVDIPEEITYIVDKKSVLRRVSDGEETSYTEHFEEADEMYPSLV